MGITYNEPGVTYSARGYDYSGTLRVTSQGLQMGARILAHADRDISIRVRISNSSMHLMDMKGRISVTHVGTVSMRGNVKAQCATYNQVGFTYNQPGANYLGCLNSTVQLMSMKARISVLQDQTLTMRGNIKPPKMLDMRALIKRPQPISMRARLSRRQGWPIPDALDPSFSTFQPTQLQSRARITGPQFGSQSFQALGRITHGATLHFQMRGRIAKAHELSMKATIAGKRSGTIHFIYHVQSPQTGRLNVVFYTEGLASSQTLGMGARVAAVHRQRFTGYFLVSDTPQISDNVQVLNFSNFTGTHQSMVMRAFIKK